MSSLTRAPVELTVDKITLALTNGFTSVDDALTTGMLRTATEVEILDAEGNIVEGGKVRFIVNPSFRTTASAGKTTRTRKPKTQAAATPATATPEPTATDGEPKTAA